MMAPRAYNLAYTQLPFLAQFYLSREGTVHGILGLPISSDNQDNPSHPPGQTNVMGNSSIEGFLLGDTRLCQVDSES